MAGDQGTWTLEEVVKATGGREVSGPLKEFRGVGTDSRQNLSGRIFIPLKGDNFDAHDFVGRAVEQGAACILVHEWRDEWNPLMKKASFVQVAETLRGLQDLGNFWRRKHKFKVIGITGSNGKTSTKEFTAALLRSKYSTHASKGSFNNHWGVPLTILDAGPQHEWLVLEMGMNHAGELTRLCEIGEPDIVAITTVGRGHIGELGSEAGVAAAKEEIFKASPNAVKIFNLDNPWTRKMEARYAGKHLRFSGDGSLAADVTLCARKLTWDGLDLEGKIAGVRGETWVKVIGRHNAVNLMCASSLALAAGLSAQEIWTTLASIQDSSWGRNQIVPLKNGARVLFDAYNANPDSLEALLKNIYEMDIQGRRFLVMGDMRELGAFAKGSHRDAGALSAKAGFEGIWYIGSHHADFAQGLGAHPGFVWSADFDPEKAAEFLSRFKSGDLVAVKASRGMRLERVVEAWPLAAPLGKKPS